MSEASLSPFESGVRLGDRYRLGERLAAGGVGQIFEAVDERLDRRVAVKVVRTPALSDRATLARLEREARAAARIRHPGIVDVTDFGTTADGFPFLVMERLDGVTLEERIAEGAPLPVSLAVELHVQLLDALAAAHAAGVLHRDVKPANVLVGQLPSGATIVTLLDFGLAALAEGAGTSKLTDGGVVLGSPAYLAPERLLGQPADARADVYAVGVCLFEALTGARPFEAPSALVLRGRVLTEKAPRVRSIRPELGEALDELVARALAKSPEERFATAAEMRDALRALGATGAPTIRSLEAATAAVPRATAPRDSIAAPRARGRGVGRLVVAAIVISVLVAAAMAWASPDEAPPATRPVAALAPSTPPRPTIAVIEVPRPPASLPATTAAAPAEAPPPSAPAREERAPRVSSRRGSATASPVEAPPAEAPPPPPTPTPAPAIDRPIEPAW